MKNSMPKPELACFTNEELLDEVRTRIRLDEEAAYELEGAGWSLKLKNLRLAMKMKRKDFAAAIGTCPRVLSMAETGARPKTAKRFVLIIQGTSKLMDKIGENK